MLVLGIYGSPRNGGNSDFLLDRALEGAEATGLKVQKIFARKLKISGCMECGGCDETGKCIIKDEMQDIYPILDEASAIILATPIFFYSPPAQVKALIDRSQAFWSRRMIQKSPQERKQYDSGKGYLIAVGATKGEKLFDCTRLVAKYFFDALDMEFAGELLVRGVEKKGSIKEKPEMLDKAHKLGIVAALGEDFVP